MRWAYHTSSFDKEKKGQKREVLIWGEHIFIQICAYMSWTQLWKYPQKKRGWVGWWDRWESIVAFIAFQMSPNHHFLPSHIFNAYFSPFLILEKKIHKTPKTYYLKAEQHKMQSCVCVCVCVFCVSTLVWSVWLGWSSCVTIYILKLFNI